jgi:hypothetical protein
MAQPPVCPRHGWTPEAEVAVLVLDCPPYYLLYIRFTRNYNKRAAVINYIDESSCSTVVPCWDHVILVLACQRVGRVVAYSRSEMGAESLSRGSTSINNIGCAGGRAPASCGVRPGGGRGHQIQRPVAAVREGRSPDCATRDSVSVLYIVSKLDHQPSQIHPQT